MQTSNVQRPLRKRDLICPRISSVHTGVGVLEVRKCSKASLFGQSATDRSHVVLLGHTQLESIYAMLFGLIEQEALHLCNDAAKLSLDFDGSLLMTAS